jgi:hypothetical protein
MQRQKKPKKKKKTKTKKKEKPSSTTVSAYRRITRTSTAAVCAGLHARLKGL